jgi:hypothetical protein
LLCVLFSAFSEIFLPLFAFYATHDISSFTKKRSGNNKRLLEHNSRRLQNKDEKNASSPTGKHQDCLLALRG